MTIDTWLQQKKALCKDADLAKALRMLEVVVECLTYYAEMGHDPPRITIHQTLHIMEQIAKEQDAKI